MTKILTVGSFEHLDTYFVGLNVYDFNTSAIQSYKNAGFKVEAVNGVITPANNEHWTSYKMMVSREEFMVKVRCKVEVEAFEKRHSCSEQS